MTHIALLGDSVIDNKAYVGQGPDVAEQLRMVTPKEWEVTRLAVDGAVSSGVLRQLDNLPAGATHLVISAGGNDALGESAVLDATAQSVGEVLMRLAEIQDRFQEGYARMLDAADRRKLPTAICSVYDPRFPEPLRRRVSALALSVINDVITREAFSRQFTHRPSRDVRRRQGLRKSHRAVGPRRHEVGARHTSFCLRSAAGRHIRPRHNERPVVGTAFAGTSATSDLTGDFRVNDAPQRARLLNL